MRRARKDDDVTATWPDHQPPLLPCSRRAFLTQAGGGCGALAVASLLADEQSKQAVAASATNPLAPQQPHFAPRAKRVIWLFMHGGPSQVDLFDPKPDLARLSGQPLPQAGGPPLIPAPGSGSTTKAGMF